MINFDDNKPDSELDTFNLESYLNIPNIRYLSIEKQIEKLAEKKEVDWYDYWPDLKEIEIRDR